MGSKSLIRSRWAAIGAAVAVTLGGGGLIGVSAASGDASSLKTTTPTRIMDTRQGSDGKVSGETVALQVTGEITTYASNGTTPAATVVPAGANAVAVNLTVTQGERNQGYGFVTAFPCTAATDTVPNASTLNFVEGTDVANSTVVPLGATGKMCLNVYGSAHVIVDVSGYYETAAAVDAYTKAETDALLDSKIDSDGGLTIVSTDFHPFINSGDCMVDGSVGAAGSAMTVVVQNDAARSCVVRVRPTIVSAVDGVQRRLVGGTVCWSEATLSGDPVVDLQLKAIKTLDKRLSDIPTTHVQGAPSGDDDVACAVFTVQWDSDIDLGLGYMLDIDISDTTGGLSTLTMQSVVFAMEPF